MSKPAVEVVTEAQVEAVGKSDPLSHPNNLFNRISLPSSPVGQVVLPVIVKKMHNGGRPNGKVVTLTEKILIGATAKVEGTTAAARAFGVAITTADGYMDGHSKQGKKGAPPDPVLKKSLDSVLTEAKEAAADRILKSINVITEKSIQDNLKDKPLQAAAVASTLATVIDKLSPKGAGDDNRVQVVIYNPGEQPESAYERKEVPLTMEER